MPNWCDNTLNISHDDKAKIDELEAELSKGEDAQLFQHLRPGPEDWDYYWSVENWGTKWEARIIGWDRISDDTINVAFETAWGPPITLYENLEKDDWSIQAFYYEPGMCFAGVYEESFDDHYDYSGLSADEIDDALPEELNEMYCIAEQKRDWEQEEDDEEPVEEIDLEEALAELKAEFEAEIARIEKEEEDKGKK